MSAWILSKTHINELVRVAAYGPRDGEGSYPPFTFYWKNAEGEQIGQQVAEPFLSLVGRSLWEENYRSVGYRYNEDDGPVPEFVFDPRPTVPRLSIAEAAKAIHCYAYQTCEHPEWELSPAFGFCEGLKHRLLYQLPGYDEAPWGIDDPDQTEGEEASESTTGN